MTDSPRRTGQKALLALAVPLLVGGCTAGVDADEVARVLDGMEPDISTWSLPYERYNAPDGRLLRQAEGFLIQDCLDERGIDGPPMPIYDFSAPMRVTHNSAGRRLFNPEIAAQYGYQEQLDPQTDWEQEKKIRYSDFWDDEQNIEVYLECADVAAQYEGTGFQNATGGDFSNRDVLADEAVQSAASRWVDCMAPLGIPGLISPVGFPPFEVWVKWGHGSDIPPWDDTPAPEDEIRIAVFDAECQQSSGWEEALYEAMWDDEVDYLKKHFNELEALRSQYEIETATYWQIIRDHKG